MTFHDLLFCINKAPSSVLAEISSGLKTFVEDLTLQNVVAAVAKYPSDNNDGELFTEIVPFISFSQGKEQFIKYIQTCIYVFKHTKIIVSL